MEQATKHLGNIEGLCACYSKETLNGRGYSKIYRNILDGKDYRFNEMMRRGGILCEFGHPAQVTADFERTETDLEKACAIITEITEGEDGKIFAKGKILDTPAGRIYKAISPFYKFGFSSRGSYEAAEDGFAEGPDGWNQDTYIFKGFDIVALPANEGSAISVTESIGSGKKIKSARESLDLNEIASATNVDPEEINRELDKIFNNDGDIEGSELITMREYSEMQEKENPVTEEPAQSEEVQQVPENAADIESPASDIKTDLQTALSEAAKLREDLERKDFDLQNANAELEKLRAEKEEFMQRAIQAEKALKDYEEIKYLSEQLVDSYHGVKDQFEAEKKEVLNLKDAAEENAKSWQERAESAEAERDAAKAEAKIANESLSRLRTRFSAVSQELSSAKESLVDMYSTVYGADKEKVLQKLGKTYRATQVKGVVESIVNDKIRLSSVSAQSVTPTSRLKSSTESLECNDDVDRELLEMIKAENGGY